MLNVVVPIVVIAVIGWLAFAAIRYAVPGAISVLARRMATIIANPFDYLRGQSMRTPPAMLRSEQRRDEIAASLADAQETVQHRLTAFKDGREPSFASKTVLVILLVLWLISIVAVFLIDLPIISAVSGNMPLYSILGTLLFVVVPVILSVLLGFVVHLRRTGAMNPLPFSLVLTALLTGILIVVALLTSLAPIRADVEYGDQIRMAQQQLAQYQEDGDATAMRYQQIALDDLTAQKARSAEYNSTLVPVASAAEFATGLFVPTAFALLLLMDAKSTARRRQKALVAAEDAIQIQGARRLARLSRFFGWLGLTQAGLARDLITIHAENAGDPPEGRALEAGVAQAADTATTDPRASSASSDATVPPQADVFVPGAVAPSPTTPTAAAPSGAPATAPSTPASSTTSSATEPVDDPSFDLA